MKFCFVCGKRTEKLIKGYCEDCYNKSHSLIEIPGKLDIVQCSKCKKVKYLNSWVDDIETAIGEKIKVLGQHVKISIKGNEILVTGSLKDSKKIKEDILKANVKIIKTVCEECSKKYGGYYEAVMQLRGNVSDEVIAFIDREVNKKSFYSSKRVRDGFDLYVGSKGLAEQIADIVGKKYKLKIKKSYKLFTKKEGRDVYRSIILIKCD